MPCRLGATHCCRWIQRKSTSTRWQRRPRRELRHDEQRHVVRAIPAKVSDRLRAIVIAGLAKLVDEVNQ